MNKLLIISGPTAIGKTSLAFSLARKYNGEIISADSRQVFRGMDIVTGKDLDKDIETWVVDVARPNEDFNVSAYYDLATKALDDIWKRNKLPIIVGGTGFYIKAILDGIGTMGIKPDWELRKQLAELSVEELGKQLQKIDPNRWERMNASDRKNPRRLVRAIEVSQTRKSKSNYITRSYYSDFQFDVLWVGLTTDLQSLYKIIDERVDERLQMGAVEEAKVLADKFGWDISSMTGQGYRELRDFIEGKISLGEAIKRWKFSEHKYARKQMTWFRKEKRNTWFDIGQKDMEQKVEEKVKEWYT